MNKKTISVSADATLSFSPDLTVIVLKIANVLSSYEEALNSSSKYSARIRELFYTLGFKREDIKTQSFNINTKYESYRDKNDDYRKRLVGYEYVEELKISFLNDNSLLSQILYKIKDSGLKCEIDLSYALANLDEAKNKALVEASKRAVSKARLIATTLNVTLGDILDISYTSTDYIPSIRRYDMMECRNTLLSAPSIDIEPDDIDIKDNICIVYEIL